MNLSRRPPPRHSGLFTAANDAKILPQLHGQRLSNRKIKTARMISAPLVISNLG
jgi:hypothetical protein